MDDLKLRHDISLNGNHIYIYYYDLQIIIGFEYLYNLYYEQDSTVVLFLYNNPVTEIPKIVIKQNKDTFALTIASYVALSTDSKNVSKNLIYDTVGWLKKKNE